MSPIEASPYRLWYNDWVQKNAKGKVLDVGKSRFWHYGFPTMDINRNLKPTYIGDIENAPFKNESFDTVLCNGMFEFVNSPQRMIDEVLRITRHTAIFGFVGAGYKPYRKPWKYFCFNECVPKLGHVHSFGDEYYFFVCGK